MSDRIVTLKIAKCGECPCAIKYVRKQWFCREKFEHINAVERETIPTWCPLRKKEKE